jgi:hypothetical protein
MGRMRPAQAAAFHRRARVIRVSADMEQALRGLLAAWDACNEDVGWEPLNNEPLWDGVRRILAEIDSNERR